MERKKVLGAVAIAVLITAPLSYYLVAKFIATGSPCEPANYDIQLPGTFRDASQVPIGVAVDADLLKDDPEYAGVVSKYFNSLTPENAMKMGPLRPSRDEYYWTDADFIVDFAEQANASVHGHCLVWHQQLPSWVSSFSGTRDDWVALLKEHVQAVVGHYKGRVASWDVVNEAIEPGGYRDTIWYEHIGPEYLEYAFTWAHEADPAATLYYNDYDLLGDLDKLDEVLGVLNGCVARGAPIDGVGLQAHVTSEWPSNGTISDAISKIGQYGFKVRVSELDVAVNPSGGSGCFTQALAEAQEARYGELGELFLKIPRLTGISVWGVDDGHTWLVGFKGHPDWPLLFDGNYAPKPAARGFYAALA
ncbi:MAG: endo-1,4-beta-xylanase [Promethearchaeota archaeon]